ncbi:MAG: tetratricopeptide repeat protein [Candidatus Obscuribacterales bacterium]|nr:tetratricopeptide repeat protein [Candidatus Obscuribacterales bacterium]
MAKTKSLHSLQFILAASLTLTSGINLGSALFLLPQAAEASSKKGSKASDNDGIDKDARPYINKGQWSEAIQKLEQLTAADSLAGRNEGWLAFAYLFTGKQEQIKELDKKVQAMPANDKDPNIKPIVNAFALTVQGKFDDAEKLLNGLKEDEKGDALLTFAKACVALKKGNKGQAAEYCEKVVAICPDFAWGYRTLGFIQDKSLHNVQLAERAYEKALLSEPGFKEVRSLLIDLKLSKNDFDGAIASSKEAIKLFPKDAGNYYRLAQIYQQQWRLNEALEQLKKAVSLQKDDPRFFRAMASIYRFQEKLQDAVAEQEKAVQLSKDKAFELIELSALQDLNQNPAGAIASLNAAIKESPTNQIVHQKLVQLLKKNGKQDELIAEYKRELELQPKLAGLRLSLAEALKQAGKSDEAVEALKEAANLDQKDPRAHREIAKIELEKKNYSAAAKSYIRALNINPGSVEDLVALGFCYASNNDYMQAETAFVTGLALQQLGQSTGVQSTVNPFDIMRSLSSVLLTEGRYREAVVNLESVVLADKDAEQKALDQYSCSQGKALRDRNGDSLKELETSYSALSHAQQLSNLSSYLDTLNALSKRELALEILKKFPESELKEKNPLLLAQAYLAQERSKEAREILNNVIADSKNDSETLSDAYVEISHVSLKEGDRKAAMDALVKACELNSKDFNAAVELGRLYVADKKIPEAQQFAQKALEVNPYCVPALLLLAETYMAGDKFKDAEGNYQKAADLYPTSVDAHKGLYNVFQKQGKNAEAQREQEIINNLSKN